VPWPITPELPFAQPQQRSGRSWYWDIGRRGMAGTPGYCRRALSQLICSSIVACELPPPIRTLASPPERGQDSQVAVMLVGDRTWFKTNTAENRNCALTTAKHALLIEALATGQGRLQQQSSQKKAMRTPAVL
jgi:hypothetical protein